MFDDLEHIIEERARSVDLNANRYYDFLYSFHVSKDNYRKAAHIMFECGMRLATEVSTVQGGSIRSLALFKFILEFGR